MSRPLYQKLFSLILASFSFENFLARSPRPSIIESSVANIFALKTEKDAAIFQVTSQKWNSNNCTPQFNTDKHEKKFGLAFLFARARKKWKEEDKRKETSITEEN